MNSFMFTAVALCVVLQCASGHYQSQPRGSYGAAYPQQRKMAPTPQTYAYQQPQQQQQYLVQQEMSQQYEQPMLATYEPQQPASYAQKAMSSYEEPAPISTGYSKPAATGYAKQMSYAALKPAPKYEEPYYPPMPFAWGYDINDGYGGAQYHKENGDEYGKRTGSYGYTDAYGIYRQVDYVADEHGFRATIKTNEPGTANESPASVDLHAYEPPSNHYSGNSYSAKPASYSQAAPSTYAAATPAPVRTTGYSQKTNYQQQQTYTKSAPVYQQAPRAASYTPADQNQYSSSVILPVYHKVAATTGAHKRY